MQGDGLVKTIQFKNPTYVGDPINAVRIFNKTEADELVFLDIMASRKKGIFAPGQRQAPGRPDRGCPTSASCPWPTAAASGPSKRSGTCWARASRRW